MRWPSWVLGIVAVGLVAGCSNTDAVSNVDGGPDASADTDGDTDVDSDVDTDTDTDTGTDAGTDAGADDRVFGVTVADPWVADAPDCDLNDKLDGLIGPGGRRPTARVVFDEGIDQIFLSGGLDASVYVGLVGNIAPHAIVMGELLDSLYVVDYDLDQYRLRACEYRATLGHLVDIWEIGNEVNGEWLGDGVLEKLAAAAEVFAADNVAFESACPGFAVQPDERPFRIALTFYYNGPYDGGIATADNCWSEASHAMDYWLDDGFAAEGSIGTEQIAPVLDLVLVSYYEDGCDGIQPEWQPVFDHLGTVFPAAALGFGECGTEDAESKAAYVTRYYQGMDLPDPAYANMHVDHPRFVGGLFWRFFSEDLGNPVVYGALVDALDGPFWGGGG